jgi:hypothetical protein
MMHRLSFTPVNIVISIRRPSYKAYRYLNSQTGIHWHYFASNFLMFRPMPSNKMMQTYFPYGAYTQQQPSFFEMQSYLLWVKSINTSLMTQYESRIQKLKTILLDPGLKGKDRRKYRQRKLRAAKARTECANTLNRVDNELFQLNAQVYSPPPPVCPIVVPQYIPATPIYSPSLQYPHYQSFTPMSPIPATPSNYRPLRTQSSPGPISPGWDASRGSNIWAAAPRHQNVLGPIPRPVYQPEVFRDSPLSPLTPLSYDGFVSELTSPPVVGWNPYFSFQGVETAEGDVQTGDGQADESTT